MRTARLTATAGVLAAACFLAGCIPVAWFAAQFGPEEKVEAEFVIPPDKTVLVLVEDKVSPVHYEPVKAQLTEMINQQLIAHKVAARTIPYTRIGELATASQADYNRLSVSELGARLGADLVLYVNIDEFGLRDPAASQELWKGRLQTTVRVIGVAQGRLWPKDDPAGRMVDKSQTQTVSDNSPGRGEQISKELCASTADKIVRLFYEHSKPYEGAYGDKSGRMTN